MQRSAVIAIALFGCSQNPEAAPDAGVDAGPDAGVPGVTAVPLVGCSWSYTGAFTIGDAAFRLVIDTGSNVLAVASAGCTDCTTAGVADLYTPGASAVDEHVPAKATYDGGDMSWSGELYQDAVAAGAAAARVEVAAITAETNFFPPGQCGEPDGILGIAGSGAASLMTSLAAAGTHETFALHYGVATGNLWLGGYDPATAIGTPLFAPMTVAVSSYQVEVADFAVAGTSIGLPSTTYGSAIVDSGGPNIFVPLVAYTAITTAIAANPTFQQQFGDASWFGNANSCKAVGLTKAQLDAQLPTLTVRVGSVDVVMAATDSYIMTYRESGGSLFCPALLSTTGTIDLGNAMIRSHLVIFDRAENQMGFAPTPPCN